MNCYYCNQHHPGGTRFGNQPAIGVCQRCGVGVCTEHGRRDRQPGSPLLCEECATLTNKVSERSPMAISVPVPQQQQEERLPAPVAHPA